MSESPGFRGAEAEAWREDHRRDYEPLFRRCAELADEVWGFIKKMAPVRTDPHQVGPSILMVRALEIFEAMMHLGERGFAASTRIMLRILLENLFVIGAVCSDKDTLKKWVRDSVRQRLRRLNRVSKSEAFGDSPLVAATEAQVRSDLEREAAGLGPLSVELLAEKAGLLSLYDTLYSQYCSDVHTSCDSVEEHLVGDDDGVPSRIQVGPTSGDIPYVLSIAGLLVVEAVGFVAKGKHGAEDRMEPHKADFQRFLQMWDPESGSTEEDATPTCS